MNHPKILVVGINPWVDNTGINTLINFFDGADKSAIAHIYTKAALPNTHVCDKFFRISEPKVFRSVFKRSTKTGEVVANSTKAEPAQSQDEQKLYSRKRSSVTALARELVWTFGKWKTAELNAFLDEFEPDVLFFPVYSTVYMSRLQNYIRRYTKKPVVLYVSDDNYSYKSIEKNLGSFIHRFWLRKQEKKLFKNASKLMVISPKQKEEYDELFGTNSVVMTKGIDFSNEPYQSKPLCSPIKMVYTGKMIIGRWKSLAKIAEVMGEINRDGSKIELDIFTTDSLTEEQRKLLNRNGCAVKGALKLDEVQAVQRNADILVFVESLEKKYRYRARLSFSTKITDYLKNGKCIFAIGDKDIAPIDYFKRYDSAVTATSYEEIGESLKKLVDAPDVIGEYSRKAYECGKAHHDFQKMRATLYQTIADAMDNGAFAKK